MIRLFRNRRGVAAVEFALTAPILILMFVGCYQFSDAIMVYRKVTRTSRTISDLVAQNTVLSKSDVDAILKTSKQIMVPYDGTAAQLVVMQVQVDSSGNGTVDWAQSSSNTTPPAKGSTFKLPQSIGNTVKSGYIIVATTQFLYKAQIASSYFGDIPLSDTSMMLPRGSASVRNTG